MSNITQLITDHLDIWTAADTEKKSGRGRASGNANSVYGIKKLRELIFELAVRGKLVTQDPGDEPAIELLKRIHATSTKLVVEGKIRKIKPLSEIISEELPFSLPSNWVWSRLGTIGYTQTGGTPSKSVPEYFGDDYPFVKPGDIYPNYVDYKNEGLSAFGAEKLGRTAPANSLLMVCIGTIGKCNVIEQDCVFNQQINSVTPYLFNSQFLLATCRSQYFYNEAWARSSSTTIAILNKGNWEEICIPVAPLEEQHRIVAKVDELVALCDQLEAQHNNAADAHEQLVSHLLGTLTQSQDAADFNTNWQRIATHFDNLFTTDASIDTLKQTLLQLAVMGKLVPQEPNDEPASELLKRIQAEKIKLVADGKMKKDKPMAAISEDGKPFELPQSWEWVKPEEFSMKITDGEHFRPPTEDKGVFFLSAKDVREDGISLEDPLFVSEETAKKALMRCNPEYGDLLIVSRGATVGRMCKVNIHQKFCLLGSVILVKPTSLVLSEYLSISLKSPSSFISMINASGSTAQPAIYLKDLKEIILPLPPIEEQHRIVAKVDELMALCDQLKSRITDARQCQQKLADVLIENVLKTS